MNSTKFISASELSREIGCSVGKILNAVESGIISPAGKAGNSRNAALIFLREDVEGIRARLASTGAMKAFAAAPRPPHQCRDADEVREKAAALNRAKGDGR